LGNTKQYIRTGQPVLDTDGNRVQAHGGSIFIENDTYFWYGENKEKTDGKSKIWTWGIRCYSSKDFYRWNDEGLIIPPDLNDKSSLLNPYTHKMDRPHIIFNMRTGKYVCWVKFIDKKDECFAILTADKLLGPYRIVKKFFHPFGKPVGDFDIYKEKKTERAYLYFSATQEGILACELSDDYTDVQGDYRFYYKGLKPPFCREGIAILPHENRLFMLTSSMTGYIPNPSELAELHGPLGEMTIIGNPHKEDPSGASFNSQISAIFHHPKHPNLYIALADRWLPQLVMTAEISERMMRTIASCLDRKYRSTLWEKLMLTKLPLNFGKANTSIAGYVILPVIIENGIPLLAWRDEWRIEDYCL